LYAQSDGALCRPHLIGVLSKVAAADAAAALTDKYAAGAKRDHADLVEFLRKVDYRFASEPKGEERGAPLRSVLRYIGTWPR
jgi:hypothetical protein